MIMMKETTNSGCPKGNISIARGNAPGGTREGKPGTPVLTPQPPLPRARGRNNSTVQQFNTSTTKQFNN
jgi:hypothetical protein